MTPLVIPSSFDETQQRYLRDFNLALTRQFGQKLDRDEPSSQVLLASPSNKVYAITVTDAGVIEATLIQE